ncbi:hypothetical protein INT43_000149 [Umbelopsis isabellina]|uniref:F-box domain-containing protein n=1 Tax=Mortierella isabellina TaxID=91625 RepID=A0A8H7PF51_MORIS|nr:hypothetical protein INT43_000149 [Umbelopsis isabellina]
MESDSVNNMLNLSPSHPPVEPSIWQQKPDFEQSPFKRPTLTCATPSSCSSASSSSTSSGGSVYTPLGNKDDKESILALVNPKPYDHAGKCSFEILPQDILIEIFAWYSQPQILRLVNRSFHKASKITSTKALWLLRHYPYYKALEKSMRWRFFDVAVAKAMYTLNPDIFCSRFYVRKAILKLDKEKYRFKSSKKVLQHFVLLTGKKYFGLDPEDDSEFPLQKSTGDDRAMTEAIQKRQWNKVEHIGSVSGYGYWVHAPFARQNLNSMLLEARNLAQSIEVPHPSTIQHPQNHGAVTDSTSTKPSPAARHHIKTTTILPQGFLKALRTCLYTMCSSYMPPHLNRASPYSDKYLVKLALQTELRSVYSLVLDKLGPYLTSKDREAIIDGMSFEGVTTDETFINIIRHYTFPIQYGKWNEKPLFALAWHNMAHRINLLLDLGYEPRYILPSSNENSFLHDLLCADNTSLEIYFVLLDAGLPLELSAIKKIVQDSVFDGVLLGWIIKNWNHINSRVEWAVLQDLMVAYSTTGQVAVKPMGSRVPQASLIDWRRREEEDHRMHEREFEVAVLSELEAARANEENGYADDEGAGSSSPEGDELSREDEDEGVEVDDIDDIADSSDDEHEAHADWRNMPLQSLQA